MLKELQKTTTFFALLAICSLIAILPALAINKPPAAGGTLPSFELTVPQNQAEQSYLGLSGGSGQFTVPQIKAQAVIIEVFSMY